MDPKVAVDLGEDELEIDDELALVFDERLESIANGTAELIEANELLATFRSITRP